MDQEMVRNVRKVWGVNDTVWRRGHNITEDPSSLMQMILQIELRNVSVSTIFGSFDRGQEVT